MSPKPKGASLERINNSKGYSKTNCRWATWKEQATNRRNNTKHKGETVTDASLRLGGARHLVSVRLARGWSKKEAFTKPARIYDKTNTS